MYDFRFLKLKNKQPPCVAKIWVKKVGTITYYWARWVTRKCDRPSLKSAKLKEIFFVIAKKSRGIGKRGKMGKCGKESGMV